MPCSTKWEDHCPTAHPWGPGLLLGQGCKDVCTGDHVVPKAVYKSGGSKCDSIKVSEGAPPYPSTKTVDKTYHFFIGRIGLSSGGYCYSESSVKCGMALAALNDNPLVDPSSIPDVHCVAGHNEECVPEGGDSDRYAKITFQKDAVLEKKVEALDAKALYEVMLAQDNDGSAAPSVSQVSQSITAEVTDKSSSSTQSIIDPALVSQFDADANGELTLSELQKLVENLQSTQVGSASASTGSSTFEDDGSSTSAASPIASPFAATTFATAVALTAWVVG